MPYPTWTTSTPPAPAIASRWRASSWITSQRAYVAGYNAGLAKAEPGDGPAAPVEIREAWRRGWREGDAAARNW